MSSPSPNCSLLANRSSSSFSSSSVNPPCLALNPNQMHPPPLDHNGESCPDVQVVNYNSLKWPTKSTSQFEMQLPGVCTERAFTGGTGGGTRQGPTRDVQSTAFHLLFHTENPLLMLFSVFMALLSTLPRCVIICGAAAALFYSRADVAHQLPKFIICTTNTVRHSQGRRLFLPLLLLSLSYVTESCKAFVPPQID